MKLIIAIIKPTKVDTLLEELQTCHGIVGLFVSQGQGFQNPSHLKESDLLELCSYSKIEVTVHDKEVEKVHTLIAETCHTGMSGDGRISVSSVDTICRIATGEYL